MLLLHGLIGAALACLFAGPTEFQLEATGTPGPPPAPPEVLSVDLMRGRSARRIGCGRFVSSSCDDLGYASITIADAGPDVGYRVEFVEGTLPADLEGIVTLLQEGEAFGEETRIVSVASWVDGSTDEQEPLDVTLRLVAVDRQGTESEPVQVRIADDLTEPSPDDTAPACMQGPAAPAALAVWVAALAATRRRRTNRAPT